MELNKCGHCREFPGEYKRVRGGCWLWINTNNSKEFIHSQVSPAGKPLRGHCAVTPCPQQRSLHCSIRAEIPRAAPRGAQRDKAGSLRTPERSFGEVFTVLGAGMGVRICPEQWANQQSVCWGWAPSRGCLFSKLFLFLFVCFFTFSLPRANTTSEPRG